MGRKEGRGRAMPDCAHPRRSRVPLALNVTKEWPSGEAQTTVFHRLVEPMRGSRIHSTAARSRRADGATAAHGPCGTGRGRVVAGGHEGWSVEVIVFKNT